MNAAKPWRLSERITRWSVGVATGFVALLAVVGIALVHLETGHELDALVDEELGELVDPFVKSRGTPEAFTDVARMLQSSHPFNAMAWRVWRRADGTEWGTFGNEALRELLPATPRQTPSVGLFKRWRVQQLTAELDAGLLLAGGRDVQSERTFALVALSIVALAAGMSFVAGRLLGERVGRALQRVADDARAAATGSPLAPAPAELPLEVADVAEALREALARIRDESDKARLLASGVAHELRSPLQNLLMQAEVALLRERPVAEYRGALAKQILELQELIRAVDNLVTLCASPETRLARQGQVFDLAAEARLRLRSEEARAAREGIQLSAVLPETLRFRGDRESLMLVLRNLVANAIDWSPPKGRVEVRIEDGASGVSLVVDDQGRGVAEAERERIFLPFERGTARADGRLGYGLGLALVRTVVELHQGTVRVGSSVLGGASFRVELPHPPEPALAPTALTAAS